MAKRQRLAPARNLPAAEAGPDRLPAAGVFPEYPAAAENSPRRAPIADVAGDAAERAALVELAETLRSARTEGRMIQRLPLDAVDEGYLVRDRMAVDEEEMKELCDSLRARGQQTAIEVVDLGGGRWGLISGWRRLTALRRLNAAGEGPDSVLALARAPQEAADAYLAMVEENEIRVGLSYYERARIVARAVDKGVFRTDRVALAALFQAASRSKRSKIGSFVRIVRALDQVLRYPAALTERAGLALAAALDADAGLASRLGAALDEAAPSTPEDEAGIVAAAVEESASQLKSVPLIPGGSTVALDKAAPKVAEEQVEGKELRSPAARPRHQAAADIALGDPHAVRPDLEVTDHPDGSLTLTGAALRDPAFRAKLLAWLRTE